MHDICLPKVSCEGTLHCFAIEFGLHDKVWTYRHGTLGCI